MLSTISFMGLECVEISNGALSLIIAKSIGPRILSIRFQNSDNLFAEVPDFTIDCPNVGKMRLFGGHRLWQAPEVPQRTYLPDAFQVEIEEIKNGVRVTQQPDLSGMQKSLEITLPDDSATVIVDHTLTNRGAWSADCAAWAITQMRTGGVGVLPMNMQPVDAGGYWGNRPITLWPYTDIASPHLTLTNEYVYFDANMTEGAVKVGAPNPNRWLGYWIDGVLFTKQAVYDSTRHYYDFESSSQVYCNNAFLELETLTPITRLAKNESVSHQEVWRVFELERFEKSAEFIQSHILTQLK